jgi:AcrR family transcriptional regulator
LAEVARLSGVTRMTLHRRWGDRDALIKSVLAELHTSFYIDYTGHLEKDLGLIARTIRDFCANPAQMTIVTMMAFSNDAQFMTGVRQIWDPIHNHLVAAVSRTKQARRFSSRVDMGLIVSMLQSTIITEALLNKTVPTDKYLERLVEHVLRACKCR